MPHVESATKTHTPKPSQPLPSRQAQAADRSRGTFESLLDDAAANASAAAKDKSEAKQSASAERTQKGPAPKAKSDKSAVDSKTAADQPEPRTAAAETATEAGKPEALAAVENFVKIDTEITVEAPVEATAETTPKTESAAAETAVVPDVICTVPAVPVQPLTPADAQPVRPEATEEAATEAPVIAAVNGQKPVETPDGPAQTAGAAQPAEPAEPAETAEATRATEAVETAETELNAGPVAKERPAAKAEPTVESAQTVAQPEEQAHAEKGKAPHVPLSDADKEHIARARGEGPEKTEHAAAHGKSEQTDTGSTVQKATTDVPTQQVQGPSPATNHVSSTPAAANAAVNPQTASQAAAAVPLAGVGVEIASKAAGGKKEFEIRLDPPELGRIEVRLHVDRDGNVTSRLIADRQDTLDLLKRDSSGLERALQDAGLKTSDNGMQFSLRDQSFGQQQNDENKNANSTRLLLQDEALPIVDLPAQSYGRLAGRTSGLDIRV